MDFLLVIQVSFLFLILNRKDRWVTSSYWCMIVDAHKAKFYSVRNEIFDTNHIPHTVIFKGKCPSIVVVASDCFKSDGIEWAHSKA